MAKRAKLEEIIAKLLVGRPISSVWLSMNSRCRSAATRQEIANIVASHALLQSVCALRLTSRKISHKKGKRLTQPV